MFESCLGPLFQSVPHPFLPKFILICLLLSHNKGMICPKKYLKRLRVAFHVLVVFDLALWGQTPSKVV